MSGTVYWSYPILPFGIVACTFFSDNLSRNSCILKRIIHIGLGIVEKRRRLLPGQIFREACLYLYKRLPFPIKKMYNNTQLFEDGSSFPTCDWFNSTLSAASQDFIPWNNQWSDGSHKNRHERAEITGLSFTPLRFYCSKKNGRTFHVTTADNITGEAVVQYFSG